MEIVDASNPDMKADPENSDGNGNDVEDFGQRVDNIFVKVDQVSEMKRTLHHLLPVHISLYLLLPPKFMQDFSFCTLFKVYQHVP